MREENRKTEIKELLNDEILEKVVGGDGDDGGVDLPPTFKHPYVSHRCGRKFFSVRDFGIHVSSGCNPPEDDDMYV